MTHPRPVAEEDHPGCSEEIETGSCAGLEYFSTFIIACRLHSRADSMLRLLLAQSRNRAIEQSRSRAVAHPALCLSIHGTAALIPLMLYFGIHDLYKTHTRWQTLKRQV